MGKRRVLAIVEHIVLVVPIDAFELPNRLVHVFGIKLLPRGLEAVWSFGGYRTGLSTVQTPVSILRGAALWTGPDASPFVWLGRYV